MLDYFTPYNQATLYADRTSTWPQAALVLLPPLPSGQAADRAAGQARQRSMLLDATTAIMGKYCINQTPACSNGDHQIVAQEMTWEPASGIWGSPAYWNGNLYWTGAKGPIKAYSYFNANGSGKHLDLARPRKVRRSSRLPRRRPSISSNGDERTASSGLVDGSADDSTCDGGGANCLGLYAYDATNLSNLLYYAATRRPAIPPG